jgi:hypothetical protein
MRAERHTLLQTRDQKRICHGQQREIATKRDLCREIYMLCTPDKATARACGHVTRGSPSLARFARAPAYLSARRSSGSSARAPCGDGDARRKKIVGAREGQGVTWDVLCTR